MPCDRIYTQRISAEMAGVDLGILERALTAAGYAVTRTATAIGFARADGQRGALANGRLTLSGPSADPNIVRRLYARQAIRETASRYGWQVSETSATRGRISRRTV